MPLGIGELIKPAQDALAPVGATLSDAWQAVIGDRVAAWRLRNAAAIQVKIQDELRSYGLALTTARIPERYAFAWFEEATKQDEPELQALFARLLARAAQGDQDASDRRHIETLGRLTPNDAKGFQALLGEMRSFPTSSGRKYIHAEWTSRHATDLLHRTVGEDVSKVFEQLKAVNILRESISINSQFIKSTVTSVERLGSRGVPTNFELKNAITVLVHATEGGLSLYQAVKGATPAEPINSPE